MRAGQQLAQTIGNKVRITTKLFRTNPDVFVRLGATFVVFLALTVYTFTFHLGSTFAQTTPNYVINQDDSFSSLIPAPNQASVAGANTKKQDEEKRRAEEEKRKREREEKIQRLINFLRKQKSPVANYETASLVVNLSEANGADYRVVAAIMGVESGFCKQSFWHNCFGYLNGVRYSSYHNSFSDIVPKVSRQYAARYGWNFEGLAKAYGQHEWERTSRNMRYFASSI